MFRIARDALWVYGHEGGHGVIGEGKECANEVIEHDVNDGFEFVCRRHDEAMSVFTDLAVFKMTDFDGR